MHEFHAVSGQMCTSGFYNIRSNDNTNMESRLVPLFGRQETLGAKLWIFPDLQLLCRGRLIKWTFKGLPRQINNDISCRVHLTTWRRERQITPTTRYIRTSTTERNTARATVSESFLSYELAIPAEVEPGDIVGIQSGFPCIFTILDNILSVNISGSNLTTLGYWTPNSGPTFFLDSYNAWTQINLIPLVEAEIGQYT